MTSFDEEQAEQDRWRARAKAYSAEYDVLVANEFDAPEAQLARIAQSLRRMLKLIQESLFGPVSGRYATETME